MLSMALPRSNLFKIANGFNQMGVSSGLTWILLVVYGLFIFAIVRRTTPSKVTATIFFQGESSQGQAPGLWLLVASAAISWIFAKSITNAANLGLSFGIVGGVAYAAYYLSFIVLLM